MFKDADSEFQKFALEIYEKNKDKLGLMVHPSMVKFLRTDKDKSAFAYCKSIHGEYALLTEKKFFIVIVNNNYDILDDDKKKRYVILHELKHLFIKENGSPAFVKHSIEDFKDLIVNSNWNLELVK